MDAVRVGKPVGRSGIPMENAGIIPAEREIWEDVLRHYQTFVKPMHQQFIEPTKRSADIILPRGSSPVVVDILASRIRMHLGK